MGLELTVGRPKDVFTSTFARAVATHLECQYAGRLEFPPSMKPWRSEELPWSGWAELQSSVAKTIQKPIPFHLGSVEAWSGVFLPIKLEPAELKIAGSDTPLQVASTVNLKRELCEYARRRRLPTENGQLQALFEQYLDDDAKVDTDYDVQVYSQLMQAVNNSLSRKQPLWVVK